MISFKIDRPVYFNVTEMLLQNVIDAYDSFQQAMMEQPEDSNVEAVS